MNDVEQRDVVVELAEAAAATTACEPGYLSELLRRARDEIVALREQVERIGVYNRTQGKAVDQLIPMLREEALEEAALALERMAARREERGDYTADYDRGITFGVTYGANLIRSFKDNP